MLLLLLLEYARTNYQQPSAAPQQRPGVAKSRSRQSPPFAISSAASVSNLEDSSAAAGPATYVLCHWAALPSWLFCCGPAALGSPLSADSVHTSARKPYPPPPPFPGAAAVHLHAPGSPPSAAVPRSLVRGYVPTPSRPGTVSAPSKCPTPATPREPPPPPPTLCASQYPPPGVRSQLRYPFSALSTHSLGAAFHYGILSIISEVRATGCFRVSM